MSWGNDTTAGTYLVSKDITKGLLNQQRVDYETPAGQWPSYKVHSNVVFFGTTTRTVTKHVGLTKSAAEALVTANTKSTYAVGQKTILTCVVDFLFERVSKRATLQRVDASGQYHVTVEETSVATDGTWTYQDV